MRKSLEQKADEALARTKWKSQCRKNCPLRNWCDPVNDGTRGAALYAMCYHQFVNGYKKGYRQHQKETKTISYADTQTTHSKT